VTDIGADDDVHPQEARDFLLVVQAGEVLLQHPVVQPIEIDKVGPVAMGTLEGGGEAVEIAEH
jgi:hypothetical protein